MAKYIIDVPEDRVTSDGKLRLMDCVDSPVANWIYTGIFAEPFDRKAIENEAWEFVKALYGLSDEELYEIFPNGCPYEMTYSEAKAKYDEWKREKDKIHVGDEVRHTLTNAIGVVTQIRDLIIMWEDGSAGADRGEYIEKTGRHFDSVEKLLEEMRGE